MAVGLGRSPTCDRIARSAPEWVKQIAPGTWAEVSLNTLADVNPARDPEVNPNHPGPPPWRDNQGAVLGAWNGGAFASGYGKSGALILVGGGHTDYYGNEVYAFDLDSRNWQRLTNPYRSPSFPVTDGIWPDGTPSVSHTYDQVDYHPATNSFVMMKTQHHNTGGQSSPVVAMFSLDGLKPARLECQSRCQPRQLAALAAALGQLHAVGRLVRLRFDARPVLGQRRRRHSQFRQLRPESHGPGRWALWGIQELSAPHVRHGRGGCLRSRPTTSSSTPYSATRRTSGPSISPSQPPGTAATCRSRRLAQPRNAHPAHGWEWSPARRAFVYYRRGAGVYRTEAAGLRTGGPILAVVGAHVARKHFGAGGRSQERRIQQVPDRELRRCRNRPGRQPGERTGICIPHAREPNRGASPSRRSY
jgi:hypothetical protein